jgi:glucosylceramidase
MNRINYKYLKLLLLLICTITLINNKMEAQKLVVDIYETSANGNSLKKINPLSKSKSPISITVKPEEKFQTITGFGGSFTQSTAFLLNKLSNTNRNKIIEAYFSKKGANYSLTRTHINSCDFSTHQYAYNSTAGDTALSQFDISEDEKGYYTYD